MAAWKNTNIKGIRYREHPTRKHGVKFDRYYTIRFQSSGKRVEESLGWTSEGWTLDKANATLSELREAARKGDGPKRLMEKREIADEKRKAKAIQKKKKAIDNLSFGDFFHQTYFPQAQVDKTERSWKREEQMFRIWVGPIIGKHPMKDVSPIHLERIKKNMLDTGRAPRSVHYTLAFIRQVFNHAHRLGLFHGDNPVKKIKKPSSDNRRLRFLSHNEAEGLLEALRDRSNELYEQALISLHCGLRAGEIFSLTFGDVDLSRGRLSLRDTKSGKSRTAILTQDAKAMLKTKTAEKHGDYVFPARNGQKRGSISKTFDRTVKEIGLNNGVTDPRHKVVFHTLRHTYASWLVEQGVDLYTVKELMGHGTIAMTERYAHLAPDTLQRAVRTLEAGMEEAKMEKILTLNSK